ncbi:MAG TPA: glycosyltransferase family 1 protein [Gemmatimonadaceae bacterium]|nr:glycosyltransferase family 1 protein [Gemmatimonadaceae bacterium]
MRIGLNLLPFHPGTGGTWQYVAGLLAALAEHDRANEYVAYVTSHSDALVPRAPAFRTVPFAFDPRRRPMRVLAENLVLRGRFQRDGLDCMHHLFNTLPRRFAQPSVVTVYDVMAFERPGDFPLIKRRYLHAGIARAARHAAVLAPMSRSTADHLRRMFGVDEARIVLVPASIGDGFRRANDLDIERFRRRYSLPAAFWLFVSGAYMHKNHATLLRAFQALRATRPDAWPLVVRGEVTPEVQRVIDDAPAGISVLPRLADHEMPLLYSAAAALVFPSLFEGAGLPLLEAMACGCPVVASDLETTAEFAPGAALMFNPGSEAELTAAMRRVEESAGLRETLQAAGLAAVASFRPAAAAAACLRAYEVAARTKSARS